MVRAKLDQAQELIAEQGARGGVGFLVGRHVRLNQRAEVPFLGDALLDDLGAEHYGELAESLGIGNLLCSRPNEMSVYKVHSHLTPREGSR